MIRMGMKNAIDWKKLGVDDVFTAASGNEALKILKEEGPEIMVTDIQMTEMTGLELIKAARESVPELRVIVLTGFDNFEYARESLRLQVQDFFLKPIDEDERTERAGKQRAESGQSVALSRLCSADETGAVHEKFGAYKSR